MRFVPAITGPARSITPYVTVFPACSIIPAVTGSATVINPSEFTTYIKYVPLLSIAIKDLFRVWLQFILPPIDWNGTGKCEKSARKILVYITDHCGNVKLYKPNIR